MKPTKNRFYCPGCQHQKMIFASKKKAIRFLMYNADSIEQETGKKPIRAYYCKQCCGWHVTSKPNSYGRKDLIRRYGVETGNDIYIKIFPLIAKGSTVSMGLARKLKELRHNLKFQSVNCDKCNRIIDELFNLFEVVIGAYLEDKPTIDKLFSKFSTLCNQFSYKEQAIRALP